MSNKALTPAEKQAATDLKIIIAATLLSLGVYLAFNDQIVSFIKEGGAPVLLRLLLAALFQFGVAGLGITIVCSIRKEPFSKFGLIRKNALPAILLSCLMYLPHMILTLADHGWDGYYPLQTVWTTKEILASGLPVAIIGMLITALAWGFFEGFNYAVIADKINIRLPAKHWWLDRGAVICAGMCVLIHGAVGVTPKDILEMLAVMIIIYGCLMVRKKTGNAWGLVFTFLFLWNAY